MNNKAINNETAAEKARRIYQRNALEMEPRTKREKEQSKRQRERLKEQRRARQAGELAPIQTGYIATLKSRWSELTQARQFFIVFGLVPTLLGMLIYFLKWKYNVKSHQHFNQSSETYQLWQASKHPWCYVLAITTWFTVIWSFLGKRKNTYSFLKTENGDLHCFADKNTD